MHPFCRRDLSKSRFQALMLDWPFRLTVAGSCNTDSPQIRSARVNGAQISCSAGSHNRADRLRADSDLLDEIQKRPDLRRREVARGMIGIERIEFLRPFRQDLNKLTSRQ
jgi:hypothetical protein